MQPRSQRYRGGGSPAPQPSCPPACAAPRCPRRPSAAPPPGSAASPPAHAPAPPPCPPLPSVAPSRSDPQPPPVSPPALAHSRARARPRHAQPAPPALPPPAWQQPSNRLQRQVRTVRRGYVHPLTRRASATASAASCPARTIIAGTLGRMQPRPPAMIVRLTRRGDKLVRLSPHLLDRPG